MRKLQLFKFQNGAIFLAFVLILFSTASSSVAAKDIAGATAHLQNSVRRLSAWLSKSDDASAWRRYLLLNVLETQTAKGDQADVATLMQIRDRFAVDNDELKKPAFNDVKLALDAQISRLGKRLGGDLRIRALESQARYKAISISTMEFQRDKAVYEFNLLRDHYRETMRSRERAELFYEMKLDETIELLEEMEFELPPEFSAGKVQSMIRDVQERLDEVVEQIDALPATPEPDDEEDEKQEPIEPAIDNDLPQLGPIPDSNVKTVDELNQERKTIEEKIEALQTQREEILEADRPRVLARNNSLRKLLTFTRSYADIVRSQPNPYFVSAAMSLDEFFWTYYYGTEDNLQEDFIRKLEEVDANLLKGARR